LCVEFPCHRLDGADAYDSFITHKSQIKDLHGAKDLGLKRYEAELGAKIELLKGLLNEFDDGRRKSFFCLAVNLLPLKELIDTLQFLDTDILYSPSQKDKAAAAVEALQSLAYEKGIALKLIKKP
jgi:hypothetical protein